MASSPATLDRRSDADLISAVRAGEAAAYGVLFARHVDAARRLARQLAPGPDADDLVSESFTKVLDVLQRGGGPDLAFRAYLLTAVRRVHVDRTRVAARTHTTDDLTPFDPGVPFRDTAVEGFENDAAARALASLPERWQLVLWHTEVEGQRPADIAPLLGMSANAVSALAYRAREGLRQAYLSLHAADTGDDDCTRIRGDLGAYVRGGLARRDARRVEDHLERCRPCTGLYLELGEVNTQLGAVLAPLVLGGAAAGYLASAGGSSVVGTAAAATGGTGLAALVGRARDAVTAHGPVAAVAGAATAAVVVGLGPILPEADQAPTRPPTAQGPAEPDRGPTGPVRDAEIGDGPVVAAEPLRLRTVGHSEACRHDHAPGTRTSDGTSDGSGDGSGAAADGGADPGGAPDEAPGTPGQAADDVPAPNPQPAPEPTDPAPAPEPAPQPAPEPTPEPEPSSEPTRPPLADVTADVSVGSDGLQIGVGLDVAGRPVLPPTTVGVGPRPAG